MASCDSERDAKYALSRLLQRGTVIEYHNEFEMFRNRVTVMSQGLLKTLYIFRLKPSLQLALLRSNPTTLGEAFSLAYITEACFADQGPATTIATPTSPILTISGYQNKASDSSPEVAIEVATEDALEVASEVCFMLSEAMPTDGPILKLPHEDEAVPKPK
ncbi:hypothetical protein Tco_1149378 [Tanacetum coccineum]